jgi:hypothetical protein
VASFVASSNDKGPNVNASRAAKIVTTIVRDSPARNLRSSLCDARSERLPGLDSVDEALERSSIGCFTSGGVKGMPAASAK